MNSSPGPFLPFSCVVWLGLRLASPLLVLAGPQSTNAVDAPAELARQAHAVFQEYCFSCHGQDGADEGGMDYVTDLSQLVARGKVHPNDPSMSRVLIRMHSSDDPMPPQSQAERPDAKARGTIERWIRAGAPTAMEVATDQEPVRTPVTVTQVIASVHGHLARLDPEDRQFQRYFLLNHLHNQPTETVSSSQLRTVRAAAAKVLNSLSWRFEIAVPKALDADQTVLNFDLRDIDWDADPTSGRPDLWLHVVSRYPYALKHDRYPDERDTRQMAEEVYTWTGVDVPWVRADWFVANASRPPLYHTMLYDVVFEDLARRPKIDVPLPDGSISREPAMTAADLENWLRVSVAGNLRRNRVARAGFTKSGVSSQPRMVERHPALYGAYWLSYDFKRGNPTMNLLARPLGPAGLFQDPKLQPFNFRQDGGEIIFNLPNGLQGYLLIDGKGNRIHEGPPDVVEDSAKILGNSIIVNGLSCMSCHKQGMKREFQDQVRFGAKGLSTDARDIVRRLYLDPPDMNRLVDKDESRFLAAIEECCGPFLRNGLEDKRPTMALDEPVGPIAKRFLGDELGLAAMAAELEVSAEKLAAAISFNSTLRELGLAGVPEGATIKRETWEAGRGLTMFQQVARQLQVGTPTSVVPPEN